jgi:threonine dehydratase
MQKITQIRSFGNNNCDLIVDGENFNESLNNALEYCNNNQNSLFIHPYDDVDVINGQGTIGTEILNESNPDIIIAPVGGGGLLAGIINTVNNCEIYGVEPIGADSMYKSIHNNKIIKLNKIDTFVDGASVPIVGKIPFNIINTSYKSGYLKDILKVSNGSICSEMVDLYQTEGIISEPAGALASAALSKLDKEYIKNKTIVCVLSGGNNDIMRYSEIIEKSLNHKKLKFYFIIRFKQIPGQLKQYVKDILPPLSDITRFEYIKRNNRNDGSVIIGVEFNKSDEVNILKQNMIKNNFEFIQLIETDLLYNYLI